MEQEEGTPGYGNARGLVTLAFRIAGAAHTQKGHDRSGDAQTAFPAFVNGVHARNASLCTSGLEQKR